MAAYQLCRDTVPQEVVGCLAGASLHHPLVQVSVYVLCLDFKTRQETIITLFVFLLMLYQQQMELRVVSCPHLGLESLQVRLQPVQLVSEDDG